MFSIDIKECKLLVLFEKVVSKKYSCIAFVIGKTLLYMCGTYK